MQFLKKLFAKEKEKQPEKDMASVSKEPVKGNVDALVDEIYQALRNASEQEVTQITLKKGEADLFDSKVGGPYYVPEGMDIPTDKNSGNPLFLLAQLNFAQLPVKEPFPTSGVLQLFISGDGDVYGCDFDHPYDQEFWKARYLEEVPADIDETRIVWPKETEETCLPFPAEVQYKMEPHTLHQTITISDYRFNEVFYANCKDFLGEEVKTFYDLEDDVNDVLFDKLETFACQIGGYPCFTQSDPREYMKEDIPQILLFQLDTVEDIMWGDSGVANFFIHEEALRKKDFSHVLYNWDCC